MYRTVSGRRIKQMNFLLALLVNVATTRFHCRRQKVILTRILRLEGIACLPHEIATANHGRTHV